MTLRSTAGAMALTAALLCAGGNVSAQIVDDVDEVAPIQLGPVQLYPVYVAEARWVDNLYYANDTIDPTSAGVLSMSPSLLVKVPFSQSRASFGYAYRRQEYSTANIRSNGAHFFQADVLLSFASGVRVQIRDDLQNGVLDTETFDPGGAIRFSGQRFRTNNASTGIGYEWRNTIVFLTGYRGDLDFSDPIAAYYDTVGWQGELSVEHRLTSKVRLLASYLVSRTRFTPPSDRSELDFRTEIEKGRSVGMNLLLGPASSMTFRLGRPAWEYLSAANPEKTSALIGEITYARHVPAGLHLDVSVGRQVYPSVFQTANNYADNRVGVSLANDARASLVVGGRLSYYVNRYPDTVLGGEPIGRRDRSLEGSGWVGYRVSARMEFRVYARHERRESNAPGFGYGVRSFGATLSLGG